MATTSSTSGEQNTAMDVRTGGCERFHKALCDCHRRVPSGPGREASCRHINRALADCMLSAICPAESDAVRSLCSSAGTSLKRSQCQQARLSLSVCLASHQQQ